MELKDLIKAERQRRGWSQRALASALKISPSAVAQWETGDTKPAPEHLIDLCSIFGLEARTFFGETGPYAGQLVEDPEELELLTAWRRLKPEERSFVKRMLRGAGVIAGPEPDEPKAARKRIDAG